MFFFLKPREFRCPHCLTVFYADYRADSDIQASMKSGADIKCPNCHKLSNYNRHADSVFGAGLAVAIIGMPVVFNMAEPPFSVASLAVVATVLVITGSWMRRLIKK